MQTRKRAAATRPFDAEAEIHRSPTKRLKITDNIFPGSGENFGKLVVCAVEHAKVVDKLEDLQVRHGKLEVEHNIVKLQHKVSIGRAPTLEEFEQLTIPLQKHWVRIFPEQLQQYLQIKDSKTGKFGCGYVFGNGITCGRSYKRRAAAKQCRIYCRIEAEKYAKLAGVAP